MLLFIHCTFDSLKDGERKEISKRNTLSLLQKLTVYFCKAKKLISCIIHK